MTEAFEGVLEQLQGFEDNAQALGREFNFYVESNTLDLISGECYGTVEDGWTDRRTQEDDGRVKENGQTNTT